ncbi:MAG: YCF48-related protein [Ignavibacteria bacterium]
MKRLLLTVFLVLSFAVSSFSQITWTQVSSAGEFYKIVKTSDGKYLANSSTFSPVYQSTDLNTWNITPGVIPAMVTPGFFKDHTGKVFIGTGNGLYYTPNNGLTWNSVAGFPAAYGFLMDMTEDASNILYAGTAQTGTPGVYKSTDGGVAWTFIGQNHIVDYELVPETNQLYTLAFPDQIHGNVYYSNDHANTWTEVTGQPFSGSAIIIKHYGSSVYVIRNNGEIYVSTNNGVNWNYYSTILISGTPWPYFNDALILDNGIWWVGITGIGLFRSSDNGLTWSQQNNGINGSLHYLYNDGPTVVVTTSAGIYKYVEPVFAPTLLAPVNNSISNSTTPTLDWYNAAYATKYEIQIATDATFTNIILDQITFTSHYTVLPNQTLNYNSNYYWRVFSYNENGWSGPSAAWTFKTMIYPLWTLYQTGVPYSLFGVDFSRTNTEIGVAVGQGGTVIKTTDHGQEWTLTYSNVNIWMNDVQFDPNYDGVVWAAGMGGVIIRSTNNGDTWTEVRPFSSPDHTIRGIAVKPGQSGSVSFVGYAGTFFETSNYGQSFTQRYDIPFTMHSIAYPNNYSTSGKGIICGTDGKVWNTTNYGVNWTARNTNRYDYLNDVVYLEDWSSAMICGNNGTILRTTNNGNSWSVNIQYLTSEHLRSIDAYSVQVTVCGDNGKIMTSNDYGNSFTDQLNGENRHLYGVALRSGSVGVVVGEIGSAANGALYFTAMNGGYVGITQTGSEIPQDYSVSQNYPNPFNPTTKINFSLPKQGLVTIKVYDLLGKEIETLVNEVKSAGKYTVDFNGSKLSSGVYFYRIQANDFVDVKRMMLVK